MRQTIRHRPDLDVMEHIKADYYRSKHIKTHKRDVKCTITGCRSGGFYRKQDLERHVSSRHQDAKYFCDFRGCNSGFSRKDNCQRHMRLRHKIAKAMT